MKKRRLGRTNLQVNEIGVGCWAIGGPFVNLGISGGWDGQNNYDAKQGLCAALKSGANLFDTADVYGFGKSERLLGWMLSKAIQEYGITRDEVIISSKVGYFKGCSLHGYDPVHMRHQLEMSLRNLKTDYLDIYFFHHHEFGQSDEYLDDAIVQMRNFQDEGMIKYIGLRGPHQYSVFRQMVNVNLENSYEKFIRLAKKIDPDVIGVRYNMISPTYDKTKTDVFKWAEDRDIGILIYKPLGQGLLIDKYDPTDPPQFSKEDHRNRKKWFQKDGLSLLKKRLEIIKNKFECKSVKDHVQLAIKYCLSRNETACVLVGFRNEMQIRESLSTSGYLTKEECEYIRNVFQGINEEIGPFLEIEELNED